MKGIGNILALIAILGYSSFPFASCFNQSWNKDVIDVMERVANNLGWESARKFRICHIIPMKFTVNMVEKYKTSHVEAFNGQQMNTFVQDLTMAHNDAAYYLKLDTQTRNDFDSLIAKYQTDALSKLNDLNNAVLPTEIKDGKDKLLKLLLNSPGNIFPGIETTDSRKGLQCQGFPRKPKYINDQIKCTDQMTSHSLYMQNTYARFGLEPFEVRRDQARGKGRFKRVDVEIDLSEKKKESSVKFGVTVTREKEVSPGVLKVVQGVEVSAEVGRVKVSHGYSMGIDASKDGTIINLGPFGSYGVKHDECVSKVCLKDCLTVKVC